MAEIVTSSSITNVYSNKNNESKEETLEPPSSTMNSTMSSGGSVVTPELLQMYYTHLFPYSFIYTWLNYGQSSTNGTSYDGIDGKLFSNREFSFTIEPTPGEEMYLRYQCFTNETEMKNAIIKRSPKKIDIGAVYSRPPKDKKAIQNGLLVPKYRELIFDIDMDDYDTVRNCGCSGSKICPTCWTFMAMAVKVMDTGLRNDFGFHHIAWFYSGRRGMHAWICDESAINLPDEARAAITKYFQLQLGSDKNKDAFKDLTIPMHPMLQRAYEILEPMFIKHIIPSTGHGLLATSDNWTGLLQQLPDSAELVRTNLLKKWNKSTYSSTPLEKWKELKVHIHGFMRQVSVSTKNKSSKTVSNAERDRLENWKYEIVFKYTYPRLDVNVSKSMNHLLKSPFCIHPKSGNVCVPVSAEHIDTFDPFQVPKLHDVMNELDAYDKKHKMDAANNNNDEEMKTMDVDEDEGVTSTKQSKQQQHSSIPNWQKTSLKKYYEPFQKEFLDPLIRAMRRNQRDMKDQQAAVMVDF